VLGEGAAGSGRPTGTLFAYAAQLSQLVCPHCAHQIAQLSAPRKPKSKKVAVHVLIDPSTGDFFETRGEIARAVTAPVSGFTFDPMAGPASDGGFKCRACGRAQHVVESARSLGRPLPFRCFGFYGFTPHTDDNVPTATELGLIANNSKWFSAISQGDLNRLQAAESEVALVAKDLPIPDQDICDGYNTNRLVIHQYSRWSELFPARQQLALGKLLRAISEEADPQLRDALLGAFQSHVDNASFLCKYQVNRNQLTNVTGGHDYRNPTTTAENNIWGVPGGHGQGTFSNSFQKYREGQEYLRRLDVSDADGKAVDPGDVPARQWQPRLAVGAASETGLPDSSIDLVVTDPPYAGLVQYSEMSDWSYVWLHQVLAGVYPDQFSSEITLKTAEIIENGAEKTVAFFFEELTKVWRECRRVLVDSGLLIFTFHHAEGDRWTGLLRSLFDAGFYLAAAYPTHSEALNSIVIQATKGITYDIVHVCRKRVTQPESIAWSRLRREVTLAARDQLREIEQGKDVLPGPDVQMILLGKALMLFSKHYGKVLDANGEPMELEEAMERILVLMREVRGDELPLPGSLQNLDSLTHIALLHIIGKGPWMRDDLHKELRGYKHGPVALLEAGLIREIKGQKAKLEAVPALERGATSEVSARRDGPMIDKLHLLLATVSAGRSIEKLMREWRGRWDTVTEALAWLAKVDAGVKDLANLTIRQIGALGLDLGPQAITEQLDLFGAN